MTTYTIANISTSTDYKTYTQEIHCSSAKDLFKTIADIGYPWFYLDGGFDILVDGVATYTSGAYLHMTAYCKDHGCKPSLRRLARFTVCG